MMNDITKILPNEQCLIRTTLPSYIQIFFKNTPQNAMFVCHMKQLSAPKLSPDIQETGSFCDSLNVTGSPMKVTIHSICCESFLEKKVFWHPEEENYLPLSLAEARKLLSRYFIELTDCETPLWVACDSSNESEIVLLSSHKHEGWRFRSFARYYGYYPMSFLETNLRSILASCSSDKTVSEVFCTYIISESPMFVTNSSEIIGNSEYPRTPTCIKISVDLTWKKPTLKTPSLGAKAILVVDADFGKTTAKIYTLWNQLHSVYKYWHKYSQARTQKDKLVQYSASEMSSRCTVDSLLCIFQNDYDTNTWQSRIESEGGIQEKFVQDIVNEVVSCTHPNMDVTSKLWVHLLEIENVCDVVDCLEQVFLHIKHQKIRAFINPRNKTYLACVITQLLNGMPTVMDVSYLKALEILIESGIEKLKEDFIYIFGNVGVNVADDFKKTDSTYERMNIFKYDINMLTKMYVAVDVMVQAQEILFLSGSNLKAFAQDLYSICCNSVSSFDSLLENPVLTLKVPLAFEDVGTCLPNHFSLWRCTLQTNADSTVLLYTSQYIFPPSWSVPDESSCTQEKEEHFHVFKLTTFGDRFK